MFIAMNHFKVRPGFEEEFERVWRERDSHLHQVPGFIEFHLLRGPASADYTLYASHTVWASREAFETWTHSEAFRAAHRNAGANRHIYLEGPSFEGFDMIQRMGPNSTRTESV